MRVATVLVTLAAVSFAAYQEDPCSENGGICVESSCCPFKNYISGQCPSQASDIKCCYSKPSCTFNEEPCQGAGGECADSSCCPYNNYISGLCPSQSSDVKCCFSTPACGDDSGGGGSCGASVQSLACEILNHKSITLLTINPSGVNDGADAYSNVKDTCNGGTALRSSYCCSSGCSPGGSTCLSYNVLKYIKDVADAAGPVQVNSISGACHSSTSYHYRGTAVDFQVSTGSKYLTWMSICSASGASENLGPGDAEHSTHTHCAFSS
ncbi:uncharacterized protein [Ptychodera flava]|uniref:uncharacterized protein n=1 Tax=Ptychodera flava TaxID=63121 RepID=UPI00396A87CF